MVNTSRGARMQAFLRRGEPLVWATGAALSLILLTTATLLGVIAFNGLGVFWPAEVVVLTLEDSSRAMGEVQEWEPIPNQDARRVLIKVGNRELYDQVDFRWIDEPRIAAWSLPQDAVVLERESDGNFYGFFEQVDSPEGSGDTWADLRAALENMRPLRQRLEDISGDIKNGQVRLNQATGGNPQQPESDMSEAALEAKRALQDAGTEREAIFRAAEQVTATFTTVGGETMTLPVMEIVRAFRPNAMGFFAKIGFYISKLRELFLDDPRESNMEGGLFPAIFGTVMLVFLMSIFSFPLGVMAGIYLREYAREGMLLRAVRIAVNNLAGVPSIVYGIFGLGFFIYGIGGAIDQLFFADKLAPTFGTGGLLWASLTLGLLTVPVVIVATEEALGAIPRGIREGSLSLGATKFQTLTRVLLPMASPGIMTGFILAMARAAGEVAPLMITGVVKSADWLPVDEHFPFIHLDRKFMHLGFHIYDIGFQSPNVEAAEPMVFVTTLLLVLLVLMMSSTAIYLRNRMKRKYTVTSL